MEVDSRSIPAERLDRILNTWRVWMPAPARKPDLVRRLGGDTNQSFLVSDRRQSWVVRLNSRIQDTLIDRDTEARLIVAASKEGIAAPPVYYDADCLITAFIVADSHNQDDLQALAHLFSRIHSLDIELPVMDPRSHLSEYHQTIETDTDIDACFTKVMALEHPPVRSRVVCHQDLTLANIIKRADRWIAIDWEYAACSDPAFDIAVYTWSHHLDRSRTRQLLDEYDRDEPDMEERVRYFETLYAMTEILWWHLRKQDTRHLLERLDHHLQRMPQ